MKTYKINLKDLEITLTEQETKDLIDQYMKESGGLYVHNIKPYHKHKYFVPRDGEEFYYIDNAFRKVRHSKYEQDGDFSKFCVQTGNSFKTFEDGVYELNRRQALVRIWNNYDDKYSWDIDWKNQQQKKYYIAYNHMYNEFETSYCTHDIVYNTELPYFKSAEDRNQFVESNKEDLLVVFNIKK